MNDLFPEEKKHAEEKRLEAQLKEKQKNMDYHVREYTVEYVIDKFSGYEDDNEEDINSEKNNEEAEWFIPDYQREYIWKDKQKSRFIESLLVDLPIPYIFVADIEEKEARIEIIDGAQRVKTLSEFYKNKFALQDLILVPLLNGYTYNSLPLRLQRRFNRKTIRTIELSSKMDEEGRREMFDRLNSGTPIQPIERRRGANSGAFFNMIMELKQNELFKALCPISAAKLKHRDDEEILLRFFAYLENYNDFNKSVDEFLTNYLASKNTEEGITSIPQLRMEFERMLNFISNTIPYGFRKNPTAQSVPRIRFESLSVGTALALRENPTLQPPTNIDELLNSRIFKQHMVADASNSRPRVITRLELVRDFMLGRDIKHIQPPASREIERQRNIF